MIQSVILAVKRRTEEGQIARVVAPTTGGSQRSKGETESSKGSREVRGLRKGQLVLTEGKGLQGPEYSHRCRAQRSLTRWESPWEPDVLSPHKNLGTTRTRDDLMTWGDGFISKLGARPWTLITSIQSEG